MRTLGFRTHVVLALAAAAGILLSLGRPWYGSAPEAHADTPGHIGDINGPLTGFFDGLKRWVTSSDGASGWQALDHWGLAIAAMAGVAALGALLLLAPPVQLLARDLLRYASLAAFGISLWRLVDPPGSNAGLELRNGALAGTAFALMLLVCGSAAASAPLRRKVRPRKFVPPPPPPAWGSAGPPGS